MKNFILSIIFVFSIIISSTAQNKYLTGYVKNSLNNPIANAMIFIDGKKIATKTNIKGYFKVKYKKRPKVISFLSSMYGVDKMIYKGEKVIHFTYGKNSLKTKATGTQTKIVKTRTRRGNNREYLNIYDYFKATVPGVTVSSNNTLTIRGAGSFNASNEPLFVLDKAPVSKTSIESIAPSDIKNIVILKGPEAALYGSRGANGVILITTSTGLAYSN